MSSLQLLAPCSASGADSLGASRKVHVTRQGRHPEWRPVLHSNVLHRVANEASRLSASGKLYAVAVCGVVCTLDAEASDGFRCSECFAWPTDQDTQLIPKLRPQPLPK